MPNWCSNTLTVAGTLADVDAFVAKAQLDDGSERPTALSLQRLLPCPTEFPDQDATSQLPLDARLRLLQSIGIIDRSAAQPGDDWYSWNVRNWGTKWDLDATAPDRDDLPADYPPELSSPSSACYNFDSAWSPPLEAFSVIAMQHPALSFHISYDEPGCDLAGFCTWVGGKLIAEESYDSPSNVQYPYTSYVLDDGIAPTPADVDLCVQTWRDANVPVTVLTGTAYGPFAGNLATANVPAPLLADSPAFVGCTARNAEVYDQAPTFEEWARLFDALELLAPGTVVTVWVGLNDPAPRVIQPVRIVVPDLDEITTGDVLALLVGHVDPSSVTRQDGVLIAECPLS